MEVAFIFKEHGTYQFMHHKNGKFEIYYQSKWNSSYDKRYKDLDFKEFLNKYTEILNGKI